jgi:hypothetical protein|tara:strand:+ start:2528 stop:2737 length:210 start_codon:yes stop_codon:yes gene_type:complete
MSKEGKAAPLECEGCKYLTEELSTNRVVYDAACQIYNVFLPPAWMDDKGRCVARKRVNRGYAVSRRVRK